MRRFLCTSLSFFRGSFNTHKSKIKLTNLQEINESHCPSDLPAAQAEMAKTGVILQHGANLFNVVVVNVATLEAEMLQPQVLRERLRKNELKNLKKSIRQNREWYSWEDLSKGKKRNHSTHSQQGTQQEGMAQINLHKIQFGQLCRFGQDF